MFFLPPNLFSSPPDVSSGMTTVCCPIESSAARDWETEVPEKGAKILFTFNSCLIQEHVLDDLTRTPLFQYLCFIVFFNRLAQNYNSLSCSRCMADVKYDSIKIKMCGDFFISLKVYNTRKVILYN